MSFENVLIYMMPAGAEIAKLAASCSSLLRWRGSCPPACAGVNCVDGAGAGILHKLAAAGLHDALLSFINIAGPEVKVDIHDAGGRTPLQLAR